MTKRHFFSLFITLVLFGLAFTLQNQWKDKAPLRQYTRTIEDYLQKNEAEVANLVNDQTFIQSRLGLKFPSLKNDTFFSVEEIEQLENKPFTIAFYRNDSLIYWNNNQILPPESLLQEPLQDSSYFRELQNGKYYVRVKSGYDTQAGYYQIFGFVPLRYKYELESEYLANRFPAGKMIPKTVKLTDIPTKNAIHRNNGSTLCYLEGNPSFIKDPTRQIWLLIAFFSGFIALVYFLNSLAQFIAQKNRPWMGATFLLGAVFFIRFLTLIFNFSGQFDELALFTTHFDIPFNRTLGDFLINILLLFWIMFFLHGSFPDKPLKKRPAPIRYGITFVNFFSIIIGLLFVSSVIKSLVINTDISFDYQNVFDLDTYSLLVIMGIIILYLAIFLFGHRMMLAILKTGVSQLSRWILLLLATAIAYPIAFFFLDLPLSTEIALLLVFAVAAIFNIFIDSSHLNFMWLIIWLIILSLLPAFQLFQYNAYKDGLIRLDYAKKLADLRDPYAEEAIHEFLKRIKSNPAISGIVDKSIDELIDDDSLGRKINSLFTQNSYLQFNYNYNFYAFHENDEKAMTGQVTDFVPLHLQFTKVEHTDYPKVQFGNDQRNRPIYRAEVEIPVFSPKLLLFEFRRNRREQSKVYTELLVDKPYRKLKQLGNYDFAIYNKDGRLIDNEGAFLAELTLEPPPPGTHRIFSQQRFSYLIYHAPNGNIVVLGKLKETLMKAVSLFSFILGILVIIILLFASINTLVKVLPNTLNLSLTGRPSLRRRIQLTVVTLTVVFFIFIGFITVRFFQDSSDEYHDDRLSRKTKSILTDAEHELELMTPTTDSSITDYARLVDPLSRIHRMDINFYDLTGKLVRSSEEDLFRNGVVAPQISPVAFYELSKQNYISVSADEKIGSLKYKTAYVPLKLREGRKGKTIAYLGLSYYSKQRQLKRDVSEFMGTLLNVYVFLLLIAAGISLFVANSITRGVTKIGEKLREFKLGSRNEPLEWKGKDELGELIDEYNKLIKKLEESADKLAQSEREVAWREMAKQVAHEIKNPLTPMKLSIQYLLHAYNSDPDNIDNLLKRVTTTLTEQIENLSQIASEFSTFAKMPRPENQKVLLNHLVESVYDLFHESEEMDIILDTPEEAIFVYADKNQVISVLNNLVKNAIQAIPDNRKGHIQMNLSRVHKTAIVEVKDNGTGIPDDMQEKVFVPNFTTKSSGTGLGLAIAKNIIESANGTIYFKTEADVGTSFFIELPIIDIRVNTNPENIRSLG